MIDNRTNLRRGIERQQDFLKSELLKMGYFKTPDGKQLYELTVSELQEIYENEKCRQEVNTLEEKA